VCKCRPKGADFRQSPSTPFGSPATNCPCCNRIVQPEKGSPSTSVDTDRVDRNRRGFRGLPLLPHHRHGEVQGHRQDAAGSPTSGSESTVHRRTSRETARRRSLSSIPTREARRHFRSRCDGSAPLPAPGTAEPPGFSPGFPTENRCRRGCTPVDGQEESGGPAPSR